MARAGVKNIVFVGNDHTLLKAMWFLPDVEATVGYLPVTGPAPVAALLGIPVGASAVDVLAARLVEQLDVGRLDDRYFLTEVVIPSTVAAVEIEGQYRIRPSEGGAIAVRNLGGVTPEGEASADPKDGWLEAVVQIQSERSTVKKLLKKPALAETKIPLRFGAIISEEPIEIFVDGAAMNGFRFALSIIPKRLKVITGRGRKIA
jgi:hypothetical protein